MKYFVHVPLFLLMACGAPEPVETAAPTLPPDAPIDSVVMAECGRCHAGRQAPRITTAAELVRTGSKRRIDNGTMPPDRDLDQATKKRLSDAAGGRS